MFNNFLSPSLLNQRINTQENNMMAKKPGEQSAKAARRPFGERSTNVTTPVVSKPRIAPVTPKIDPVPFESIDVENNPCFYICSYQDPKDFDDDISHQFFGKADRLAFVRNFLEDADDKHLKVNYRCEAEEVPMCDVKDSGYDLFEPNLFGFDFKLDQVKVPLPSFNF